MSASVSDARPGPPLVIDSTMSNVFRLATIDRPTTTAVSGRSIGQRMLPNRRKPVAPSTRAASSGSFGIDCRPIVNSSAFTPTPCQEDAKIMTTVLSGASMSQRGGSVTPNTASAWSSAPLDERMNDQMTPTPMPEIAYGMRNGSRSQMPPGRFQVSSASASPTPTGISRVPATHSRVFISEPTNAGSWNIST